jgi:hypothetical protein
MFWFFIYLLARPHGRRRVKHIHVRKYQRPVKYARFHSPWYWLLGGWAIELCAWELAGYALAAWWLLWLTADAVLAEVGKRRSLSPQWAPFMDSVKPIWPKFAPKAVTS